MMNDIKNNRLIWTVLLMWLCFLSPAHADTGEEGIDVQDIVFSHIQDAYTWHITEWNGKEIAISLPVLVRSEERGWDMFLSHHLHHGQAHHGYYIAPEGEHAGKVVEKNSRGEEVRPVDLSLTKNVCGLFLSCGILLFVVLRTARWYKKHPDQVPSGFTGLMEMIISYLQEGVIKDSIGKEKYKPFSSYLLTVFFFILINNLIGIIPVFPGGANITGNIAVTAVLAGCTFIAVNLFATKEYWKEIFWPDVPIALKCPVPLLPIIEIFGVFTKPVALMVRLFANMLGGHLIVLVLISLIFMFSAMGQVVVGVTTIFSILFAVFMNLIHVLIGFIQAYVFMLLSTIFIGLARVKRLSDSQSQN